MNTILFICLAASLPQTTRAANTFNATIDTNKYVCAYPISGTYSGLQRYNFYFLLVFIICLRSRPLMVKAAAATLMLFTTTTSIHVLLLACSTTRNRAAFDLDAVGAWSVLLITTLFLAPLLMYTDLSNLLKEQRAEGLFRAWGVWMAISTGCALVNLLRSYDTFYPCVNQVTNKTLTSPSEVSSFEQTQQFNCTPACFDTHQILRSPSTLTVTGKQSVFGATFERLLLVGGILGLLSVFYALIACLSHTDLSDRGTREQMRKGPKRGLGLALIDMFALLSPLTLITMIVINEMYFHSRPGLPMEEGPYTIGQWSCWVITALVLIIAWIHDVRPDPEPPLPLYEYLPSVTSTRLPERAAKK